MDSRQARVSSCVITAILSLAVSGLAQAQPVANAQDLPPNYQTSLRADRWNEDWDWTSGHDNPPPLKSFSFAGGDIRANLGADMLVRYEAKDPFNFGVTPEGDLGLLLARGLVHANVRIGNDVRVFAELGIWDQNGREDGNILGAADLALQRGFIDYKVSDNVQLRLGRQDIFDRSSRLLRAADALNYQQVFDGVNVQLTTPDSTTQVYLVEPFLPQDGYFESFDGFGDALWSGISHQRKSTAMKGLSCGIYGLWQDRDRAAYLRLPGHDRRATIIGRATLKTDRTRTSVELGQQIGKVGNTDIEAWAFATDASLALGESRDWQIGFRLDGASGNRATTSEDETWAIVFPAMFYLGAVALISQLTQ